jgi:hypothetical protein
VKVDLTKHEVAGEPETLCRLDAAALDPELGLAGFVLLAAELGGCCWKDAEGLDQAMVIEAAIGNAGMDAVTQEVIDPIGTEGVADQHLGEDGLPG